jgi:DNA-binding transcriptional LysR family regulator
MRSKRTERFFKHGTLPQMRVFEAVARLGSFTRAGEETHMAQPTVSVHMKKLAETVGSPLVHISSKRVELTAAGEALYGAVRRVMDTLKQLDESLAAIGEVKPATLRIATTTAGEYLTPPLLAQFLKEYPGVEVSLNVSPRSTVLERFARNEDELYLLTDPPGGPQIGAEPILPNPLVALAPWDHVLAGEKRVPFERFACEPLLVREPGSGTRLATDAAFSRHGLKPRIAMELGSSESIKEAMLSGLGVTLLHRYSLGSDIEARRLCILDVDGLPDDGHWHVIRSPAHELSPLAQSFVDFAIREAPRLVAERDRTGQRAVAQS